MLDHCLRTLQCKLMLRHWLGCMRRNANHSTSVCAIFHHSTRVKDSHVRSSTPHARVYALVNAWRASTGYRECTRHLEVIDRYFVGMYRTCSAS
jgi:hypothetical protein